MSKRDLKSLDQDQNKELTTKLRRKTRQKEINNESDLTSNIDNHNINIQNQNSNDSNCRLRNNRDNNVSLESNTDIINIENNDLNNNLSNKPNKPFNPLDMTPEATSSSNSRNLNQNMLTVRRNLNLNNQTTDLDQYDVLPPGMLDIDIERSLKDPNYDATYAKSIEYMRRERESQCIIHDPDFIFDDKSKFKNGARIKLSKMTLTLHQRSAIVDWLIQLAVSELDMCNTSIFLTVQILDLIVTRLSMDEDYLALVGLVSLMIAGKVEEICPPNPELLVKLTGNVYTIESLVVTEQDILKLLEWKVILPTRYQFMDRMQSAGQMNPRAVLLSNFIIEVSLQDFNLNQYAPSRIAAAAIHLARQMLMPLNAEIWTPMLQYYTTYDEQSLIPVIERLNSAYWNMVTTPERKHPSYCRYNSPQRQHVARVTALRPSELRFDLNNDNNNNNNKNYFIRLS